MKTKSKEQAVSKKDIAKSKSAGKPAKAKPADKKVSTTKEKAVSKTAKTVSNSSGKATALKPGETKTKISKVTAGKSTAKPSGKVSDPASKNSAVKTKAAPVNEKGFRSRKKTPVPQVPLVSKPVAQEMLTKLCKLYPDADCELDFKNPFELLISVILSAQTTDVQVNKATPKLFQRFPTAKALAEGDLEEIKDLIKPTGFFNAKATNIQRCAQALVERFNGEVPNTLEELTTLPGAGRKTANVVLGVAFDVPGWTVDTHVQRLSARLGLTHETDPYKIELDLQKTFPNKDWSKYSITLIWHGRRLCYARNPDCAHCPINNICPSSEV